MVPGLQLSKCRRPRPRKVLGLEGGPDVVFARSGTFLPPGEEDGTIPTMPEQATRRAKAPMETTLTEHDFQLAEVRFLVPLIDSNDLLSVAQYAEQGVAIASDSDKPLEQLPDWQLRDYILSCTESLYTQNPGHLEALLNEIGRLGGKRAETVVGERRHQVREVGGAGV